MSFNNDLALMEVLSCYTSSLCGHKIISMKISQVPQLREVALAAFKAILGFRCFSDPRAIGSHRRHRIALRAQGIDINKYSSPFPRILSYVQHCY